MANASFLVIKLRPDAPVDGATFYNYLQGLQIKVNPAGAHQTAEELPGETAIVPGSPTLTQIPGLKRGCVTTVLQTVSTGTARSGGNYAATPDLHQADSVAIGATVATQ
jgi:hypothetical protein